MLQTISDDLIYDDIMTNSCEEQIYDDIMTKSCEEQTRIFES